MRREESHIFEQPACVLPSLHLQAQAAARTPLRQVPGASANAATEKSSASPNTDQQRRREKVGLSERTGRLMTGFCAWLAQKTDGAGG